MHRIYMVLANPMYIQFINGILGREIINILPYTVHIYGYGQPYTRGVIAAGTMLQKRNA